MEHGKTSPRLLIASSRMMQDKKWQHEAVIIDSQD